jgi:integrase
MNSYISEENIVDLYKKGVNFDIDSIMFIENYLKKKAGTGKGNMSTIKTAIFRFIKNIKTTKIDEINREMITEYFNDFDSAISQRKKTYSLAYKLTHFRLLKAFFNNYKELKKYNDRDYFNPMPKKFDFKELDILSLSESEKKIKNQIFTIEEIKHIFKNFHELSNSSAHLSTRSFLSMSILLTFCGMRISEVLTIKKKDLDLEGCFLSTGMVKEAKKNKKLLLCIFPKEIIPILQDYLTELNSELPDSIWLFPSSKKVGKGDMPSSRRNFNVNLHKIENSDKCFKSHMFRKSLTTYRLNDEKHPCPTHIEEALSNHAVSSIVLKNYDQYSIEFRKRDYDKYLPELYEGLLEFLKTFY